MLNTDAYGVTDGTLFLLFCPFPTKLAPFCGVLDPHLIGLHRFSGLQRTQPLTIGYLQYMMAYCIAHIGQIRPYIKNDLWETIYGRYMFNKQTVTNCLLIEHISTIYCLPKVAFYIQGLIYPIQAIQYGRHFAVSLTLM